MIKKILYKIFRLDDDICQSCETLKSQLEIVNYEKKQMLETILSFTKPIVEEKPAQVREIHPIMPKAVPWSIKRQMLEEEDRKRAQILRQKAEEIKPTEQLEKEVGLSDAS